MLHYKQFTMLYSFISHKAKEVEEMFLAESKNLTVRDFQTVVSEFGFSSCAVAMDPLKSEALTRACTSLTWPMQRRFHRLVYFFIILKYFSCENGNTAQYVCAYITRLRSSLMTKNKVDAIKTS